MSAWFVPIGMLVMAMATADPARDVAFEQRLDETVPADLVFDDEQGWPAPLARYLDGKPIILVLAYYRCPNLCGLVLDGLAESLGSLALQAGDDFRVVAVGIDPTETPSAALIKRNELAARYPEAGVSRGWHLLTGAEPAIGRLAQAVGFRFFYDPGLDQYAHPAGFVVLTGDGRIARYFFGVRVAGEELRLALADAAGGRVGSVLERLWLLCYAYDPGTGRYSLLVMNVLRLAGFASALLLAGGVAFMAWRGRRG